MCSATSLGFGLVLCCTQPVDLYCGLICWFLHGAGFLLGDIFEQILVLFVLFLILSVLLCNTFRNLQLTSFRTLSKKSFTLRILNVISLIYVLKFLFNVFSSDILANLTFPLSHDLSFQPRI